MNLNEYVLANHQTALELLRTLCLIPSPSHHEEKRAAFCKAWLMDHGAENAFIDEAKNVIYEYNAENDVPVAIFMAHIDTVFPESVPLELTEKDGKWFCPAVGDDTANVALLMLMAAYVANEKPKTNGGIVFVMNSCEEGLGNLKGSRALNARYGKRIEQVISFDGYLDGIVGMAVGSLRYKVTVKTTGGHSFADFGNVNAIERLHHGALSIQNSRRQRENDIQRRYDLGRHDRQQHRGTGGNAVRNALGRLRVPYGCQGIF